MTENYQISELSNGLTVASISMPHTETIAVNCWINVGSRYESSHENGVAHFLEHMAFKGTKKRSAQQIAEGFDHIGGHFNAATSRETTVYYAKVLKNDIEFALDVISDILLDSLFDKAEIEKERGVILQELAMAHDTPDDIIFDYYQQTAFTDQALGQTILGPAENISRFSSNDFNHFVQTHYSANNMVLSIAGNITHNKAKELAEQYFSPFPTKKTPAPSLATYQGGEQQTFKDLEQTHLILGFEGTTYRDESIYPIQLLSIILGGGMSSRLFQEVREKRGLAYSIGSFQSSYFDSGLFSIYASCDPSQCTELINVTLDVIHSMADHILDEELTRAKNQVIASLKMGYEQSGFTSDELGRHLSCMGHYVPKDQMISTVEAITIDTVLQLANKHLIGAKPTYTTLGKIDHCPAYDHIQEILMA